MKLSIIIVSYNTKELLEECLRSIEENLGDPSLPKSDQNDGALTLKDVEVIIVDNNSTDGTREWLKKLKTQNSKLKNKNQSLTIKTIFNKENVGFAQANNRAIEESEGEVVLFLNPDTIMEPDCLQRCYRYLQDHPPVGALTCRINLPDGRFQKECHRGFPTPWNAFCHFAGLGKLFPNSRLFAGYFLGHLPLDTIHEIDACTGAFMMMPRKVGEKLDWWDEGFFWYGEDLDMCYRVKTADFKVIYYPKTAITHYHGASSGIIEGTKSKASATTQKRAAIASVKAMRVFYQKHYQDRYPALINRLVMLGISLLEKLRLYKINRQYR